MKLKNYFQSPYDQYKEHNGKSFNILKEINEPTSDIDEECLPMYQIKLSDGVIIMAWPEEIFEEK